MKAPHRRRCSSCGLCGAAARSAPAAQGHGTLAQGRGVLAWRQRLWSHFAAVEIAAAGPHQKLWQAGAQVTSVMLARALPAAPETSPLTNQLSKSAGAPRFKRRVLSSHRTGAGVAVQAALASPTGCTAININVQSDRCQEKIARGLQGSRVARRGRRKPPCTPTFQGPGQHGQKCTFALRQC